MADDPELMPKFVPMTWTPDGSAAIPLATVSCTTTIEVRLVKRARPYRRGVKLDTTRRDCLVFNIEGLIFNGCTEDGIPTTGYYPDAANALEATTDVDGPGTLVLGRRGPTRVRVKTVKVTETAETRDAAAFSLSFWEDNEDSITLQSFTPATIATIGPLATSIFAGATQLGINSDDVASLSDSLTSLTHLIASAVDLADDLLVTIESVINLCAEIEDAFSEQYDTTVGIGQTVALEPDAATFILDLHRASRIAAGAASLVTQAQIISLTFPGTVSIFDIAAQRGADVGDLISLNTGHIPPGDFYAIPPGQTVLAYA